MRKRMLSMFLAVTLGISSLGNISYAQEVSEKEEVVSVIEEAEWKLSGIEFDKTSPQQLSESVTISANVEHPQDDLQYKFVWMKDNWKEWDVLRDFSDESSVEWQPESSGNYYLYVDVKDGNGNKTTLREPFQIIKNQWSYDGITPKETEIKLGEPITVAPDLSGNTKGLQYKFVWMRNNWKEWDVLQPMSSANEAVFIPDKLGKCTIYVDIKDQEGKVTSKNITYHVKDRIWKPGEISVNNGENEHVYTRIPITATAVGDTQDLQYKFVWMKDNWKKWGVIRELGASNQTDAWYPKEAGVYKIFVDIKDSEGKVKTITTDYEVLPAPWKLEKIDLDGSPDRFMGDTVKVTAVTSGETEGLRYKFVCRRGNDWSDWEVVQELSENNSVEIPLEKAKDYNIYVDIKDQRGVTFDAYTTVIRSHRFDSVGVSNTITAPGKAVKVYPNITGETGELQFKYVWMKDNWKKWGVIKDFSNTSSVNWTPVEAGIYTIFIDVKANGVTKSKSRNVEVRGVDPNKPMIALTFDDGPGAGTGRILDTLEKYNARATFFMVGDNAKRYPSMVKRIAQSQSELGNHSLNHPQLTKLSAADIRRQINTTSNIIEQATGGARPTVMRPPGGAVNTTVRNNVGLPIILWSVDTLDWQTRNTQKTIDVVLNQARDGDIVLMHDIHKQSVEAAVQLIPKLVERGYQLVTVSEMAEARGIKMTNGGKYFQFKK